MDAIAIEEAWAKAPAPLLALVEGFPGTSVSTLPNDKTIYIADCQVADHRGGGFWTALMRLQIASPALVGDIMTAHSEAAQALSQWLEDPAAVDAGFVESDFELDGFHVKGAGRRTEGMFHYSEINLICGLRSKI